MLFISNLHSNEATTLVVVVMMMRAEHAVAEG